MPIPISYENKEWWKDAVKERDKMDNIRKMPQSFDISQIFSIVMGISDDSVPLELPQVEFSILQNWMQIAAVFTKQADDLRMKKDGKGDRLVKSYSAFIAYNGIMTEEKRRELYEFLTKYFLDHDEPYLYGYNVFSLVIQQPQQIARS